VLKGAVIGGGLELASTAHIRVAESSAYYALPEGQRGLFVGGGGSVRLPRLIGVHRMADMMLTGRVLSAEEGQALGISTYLVEPDAGLKRALELAEKVSANSPVTNFAVLQALPRIAEVGPDQGFVMEALMAAVASSSPEAQDRMQAFLSGNAAKVNNSGNGQ
jgi:enoyl-CoA hydratase/carnithine racemase